MANCTKNLPDPSIALPGEHFNSILYTGDGGTDQAQTGVGFQPDLVWGKAFVDNNLDSDSINFFPVFINKKQPVP